MEKHLYEILAPSLTSSPPCYYCGETDLVRTSVESEDSYPLCHYCKTVKRFGPVLKRKKRTIAPRKKSKNKKIKIVETTELSDDQEDFASDDESGEEDSMNKDAAATDLSNDQEDSASNDKSGEEDIMNKLATVIG